VIDWKSPVHCGGAFLRLANAEWSAPMGGLLNIMIGYFFGFALGVGCALAVMYTIWTGGYKRALRDALLAQPPERYRTLQAKAVEERRKAAASAGL
jgi:hypothetical protein